MLDTIYGLRGTNAVCIVGVGIAVKTLELSALLPSQCMTEVACGVALGIIRNALPVVFGEQILPNAVAISVRLAVLRENVTVVIILHRVDNSRYTILGYRLRQKLTEGIVCVFGHTVDTVGYLGNALLGVILVGKRSAVRKGNEGNKLCRRRRLNFTVFGVFLRDGSLVVLEGAGDHTRAELQLVKELSAKAVGPRMGGYISLACRELGNGISFGGLVVHRLLGTVGVGDDLLREVPFLVVAIGYGAVRFSRYLSFLLQRNGILHGTRKQTFLIYISILLFGVNVKGAQNSRKRVKTPPFYRGSKNGIAFFDKDTLISDMSPGRNLGNITLCEMYPYSNKKVSTQTEQNIFAKLNILFG